MDAFQNSIRLWVLNHGVGCLHQGLAIKQSLHFGEDVSRHKAMAYDTDISQNIHQIVLPQ
jgi:hypothetical protein